MTSAPLDMCLRALAAPAARARSTFPDSRGGSHVWRQEQEAHFDAPAADAEPDGWLVRIPPGAHGGARPERPRRHRPGEYPRPRPPARQARRADEDASEPLRALRLV